MSPIRDMGRRCFMSSLLPVEGKKTGFKRLIKQVAEGALKALQEGNLKALDANAGDCGCQNQALLLRRLSISTLTKECSELVGEKQLEKALVSKELEYLLLCYMLAFTKVVAKQLPNGFVRTKSDPEKLYKLSSRLNNPAQVIASIQARLSRLSLEGLREEAKRLGDPLVVTMLSEEHTHIYTHDDRYTPKAFGCLFYEIKLILTRLREEEALIGLKSVGHSAWEGTLLLQPKKRGGPFELVELPKSAERVVVFEAVITIKRDRAVTLFTERRFTEVVLACAAKDAPYEPSSTFDDIKLPAAREEMLQYAQKGIEGLQLFHVYLTTIGGDDAST